MLAGDLYHYPEERTLNRLPVAEFDQEQTRRSREALEVFLKRSGAQLWIQHDLRGARQAPEGARLLRLNRAARLRQLLRPSARPSVRHL